MTNVVNKSEIIDLMSGKTGFTKADTQRSLDALISVIEDALREGKGAKLPGFASFNIQHRAARKGRNPQTGEEIQIAASKGCTIKSGSGLKAAAAESKE